MRNTWTQLMNRLSLRPSSEAKGGVRAHRPTLHAAVEAARQEWLGARAYFETVSEPELVDHAIFLVEAAEKKYMYLLKKVREQGLVAPGDETSAVGLR